MQEKHIREKKIIDIQPKSGHLEVNEICNVTFIYIPVEVGPWYLRVIFKIVHGKPLVFNLQGETLSSRRGFLVLEQPEFRFQPLPIGLRSGITQPIEMKNVGMAKLSYDVDLKPLSQFTSSQNYNFPVLDIQHNQGSLNPGETAFLYAMFRPLEAKEYEVQLPINVNDLESSCVLYLDLKGQGYERQSPKEDRIPQEKSFSIY